MEPYVIKAGDYLAKLAYKFGFDADAVWNDPANDDLRKRRPNPNILWPTDILYIPDQVDKKPTTFTLVVGQMNTFESNPTIIDFSIRFSDTNLASQAYTVDELPERTGLTTGADGTASLSIPVTLAFVTIRFSTSGATYAFRIGDLDPVDTLSGTFQRLQNLGFIELDKDVGTTDLDTIRAALTAFKNAYPSGDGASAGSSGADANGSGSNESGLSDDGALDKVTSQHLLEISGT